MKDKAFIGASLIAGIAASLCCILPIVFALAGAGIVGASAFFAAWRPYLLGVTFLLLGFGFLLRLSQTEECLRTGIGMRCPVRESQGTHRPLDCYCVCDSARSLPLLLRPGGKLCAADWLVAERPSDWPKTRAHHPCGGGHGLHGLCYRHREQAQRLSWREESQRLV